MITLVSKTTDVKKYTEIEHPQVFRGRATSGPHAGVLGVFLKASARRGGDAVNYSILYRLDQRNPFQSYVGAETDFTEYQALDLTLTVEVAK